MSCASASLASLATICSVPGIAMAMPTLGSRKKIPATTASTSRLAAIIAMASCQAVVMSNFIGVLPIGEARVLISGFRAASKQTVENATAIEWRFDREPVPYRRALAGQESRNAAIAAGEARELIWLLEHPPVYT